jgi:hypothetical protein
MGFYPRTPGIFFKKIPANDHSVEGLPLPGKNSKKGPW